MDIRTKALNLPRYQCHKAVRAAQIAAIRIQPDGSGQLELDPLPGQVGTHVFQGVAAGWMDKHKPYVGGYFVRYDDGYESFSPAAPFEAGYTRIGDGEIFQSDVLVLGGFHVERILEDGSVEQAVFYGANAEHRAREYAARR